MTYSTDEIKELIEHLNTLRETCDTIRQVIQENCPHEEVVDTGFFEMASDSFYIRRCKLCKSKIMFNKKDHSIESVWGSSKEHGSFL